MADTKLSALTQLTSTPDPLDEFELVDKSDTSMAAAGTNKRIQFKDLGLAWVLASGGAQVADKGNLTSEEIFATITVPANAMGANGLLRVFTTWTVNNNANAKTPRVRFSTITGTIFSAPSAASTLTVNNCTQIQNRNATNSQTGGQTVGNASSFGISGSTIATAAVDTTASTTIVITGQKATGTDTLALERYLVEVLPAD